MNAGATEQSAHTVGACVNRLPSRRRHPYCRCNDRSPFLQWSRSVVAIAVFSVAGDPGLRTPVARIHDSTAFSAPS